VTAEHAEMMVHGVALVLPVNVSIAAINCWFIIIVTEVWEINQNYTLIFHPTT